MAIYHLTVKPGVASAVAHSNYIEREGKYAHLLERNQEEVTQGHGNMPEWAERPQEFWKAADECERANGLRYREIEIALPKELSAEQQKELVQEFVKEQIGEKHAYEWAIHDNGQNPHCHLMFSERERDGIERSREQYFKRANGKNPERGGCRKSTEWVGEKGQSAKDRKARLNQARQGWEKAANRALERAGHEARIDHRSHKERGLEILPQPKIGPQTWLQKNRAESPRIQRLEDVKRNNLAVKLAPQWEKHLSEVRAGSAKAEQELSRLAQGEKLAELRGQLTKLESGLDKAQAAGQQSEKALESTISALKEGRENVAGQESKIQEAGKEMAEIRERISGIEAEQEKARSQKPELPAPDDAARKELAAMKAAARAERLENQRKAQVLSNATEKAQEYVQAGKTAWKAQEALKTPQGGDLGHLKAVGRAERTLKAFTKAEGDFSEAVTKAVKDHGKQAVDAALRKALGPEYAAVRKAVKVVQSLTKVMSQSRGFGIGD